MLRKRFLGSVGFGALAGLFLFIGCSSDDAAPPGTSTPDGSTGTDAQTAQDTATTDTSTGEDVADTGAPDVATDAAPPPTCTNATFAATIAVSEASAAAEVELTTGKREMLVFGDSGTGGVGKAIELAGAGAGTERAITLPLDANGGDDVEGMAWLNGKLYVITSSGGAMRFTPDGAGGLNRDQDVYAIGAAPTYSCPTLTDKNCGKNYEGLCLRADATGKACAGYALSKSEGKLYCLTLDANQKLVASTTVAPIDTKLGPGRLSDCAFGAAGGPAANVLVLATNSVNGSKTYRFDDTNGNLTQLPSTTLTNIEAIAVDKDGALYVFEDADSGATSAAGKKACTGW